MPEDNESTDYRAQLEKEQRRRQELEEQVRRLDALRKESDSRLEENDRLAQTRTKLRELGVKKIDLAMKVIREDIQRGDDGRLYARSSEGLSLGVDDYLKSFVSENPEFLPPRISGGAGSIPTGGGDLRSSGMQLESIKPGMNVADSRRAWNEVARLLGSQ